MKEKTEVVVTILGKEYKIICNQDEQKNLIANTQQLHQKMLEIHDSGKVIGKERIAVMAALNITHELKLLQKSSHSLGRVEQGFSDYLTALRHKIEVALNKL